MTTLPAGIALMAGEASGLLDVWASSPRKVYACLRVIRQRPSESTASNRCSRCSVSLPHSTATDTSESNVGTPTRGPISPVHVGSKRRGVLSAAQGLRTMGLSGVSVQGSSALRSVPTREGIAGETAGFYVTQARLRLAYVSCRVLSRA